MSKTFKIAVCLLAAMVVAYIFLLFIVIKQDSKDVIRDKQKSHTHVDKQISLDDRVRAYLESEEEEGIVYSKTAVYKKVGYVKVSDTLVDYPVMYSDDIMYYTEHDVNGNADDKGCIFLDARITDTTAKVILIHGLVNEDGTMFTPLLSYKDVDWAMQHTEALLDLGTGFKKYNLFSVISSEQNEGVIQLDCEDEVVRKMFFDSLCKKSSIPSISEFEADKQIVVLNTIDDEGNHVIVCFMEV